MSRLRAIALAGFAASLAACASLAGLSGGGPGDGGGDSANHAEAAAPDATMDSSNGDSSSPTDAALPPDAAIPPPPMDGGISLDAITGGERSGEDGSADAPSDCVPPTLHPGNGMTIYCPFGPDGGAIRCLAGQQQCCISGAVGAMYPPSTCAPLGAGNCMFQAMTGNTYIDGIPNALGSLLAS